MSAISSHRRKLAPQYAAVRISADEYLALPDDGFRYELIDGVMVMSPSPAPKHQRILAVLIAQLEVYLERNPLGAVFPETDVRFSPELVYRPELVYLTNVNLPMGDAPITSVPDMVCEIISPDSRRQDTETKRGDYERFGVQEYWLIDPERKSLTFLRLEAGRYLDAIHDESTYRSAAVPGFILDLARIRHVFENF